VLRVAVAVLSVTTTAAGLIGFDLIGPFSTDYAKAVFFTSLGGMVVLLALDTLIGRGQMTEPL